MKNILALLSALIVIGVTIPYMVDIVKGRAVPARAARIMFLLLLVITLAQQHSLGSGLAMAVTIGETISSILLFGLAIKYGVGGLRRSDIVCYGLLALSVLIWAITSNALLALHLSMLADTVAFWPTLEKTWRNPKSETALFFLGGAVAPVLSILAASSFSYQVIVFPFYLSLVNLLEAGLIYRKGLKL
jgi:hypothetical protein